MEDAYVIGIRLVLENGVSAGLSTVREELASYDRALATTTGNLKKLRDLGAHLLAPAALGRNERVSTPRQTVAPASDGECSDRLAQVEVAAMPALPISPPSVPAVATAPERSELSAATRVAASAAEDPWLVHAASAPAQVLEAKVTQTPAALPCLPVPMAPAPVPAPPAPVPAPPAASSAPALRPSMEPPVRYANFAPASVSSSAITEPVAATARDATAATPGADSVATVCASLGAAEAASGEAAAGAHITAVALHHAVAGRSYTGPGLPMPVAPMQDNGPPAWQVPSRLAPTLNAAPTAAAPVAPPTPSGPVQGDVYLDGARMGRWMADRLARDADRPPGGITGFDSRLGITWPGTMHGT